jgi:hypothetical protein
MKKLSLKHEINCSAEQFWKVFFDKEFNTSLYKKELGFPEFDILDQGDKGGGAMFRKVRGKPKMNAPAAIKKLLGDSFGYEEEGNMDVAKKVWHFKLKPNTLTDKLRTEGWVRVEPISDTKCRRVAEMELEAKIFGVGGIFESFTEGEMKNGWDKSAVYMNQWLKDHPPT